VPHTLSDPQKIKRAGASAELIRILNDLEAGSLDGIPTGDESSAMFAKSPGDVVPRMRKGIGAKKIMAPIFFPNKKLLITSDLPKDQKYNQDDFRSDILPELEQEKEISTEETCDFLSAHEPPKSHDGEKKFETKGLVRSPHPSYSPDRSPCDFWFFGMTKGKMKDRKFRTVQGLLGRLTEIWNDLTFEDVQSVFHEWQLRLNWVIQNSGEYYCE
jgi:hypothetical protein